MVVIEAFVTHKDADQDSHTGIEKLRRFWEKAGVEDAPVIYWDGEENSVPTKNIVFVDICPEGVFADPKNNVWVFDHHPHSEYEGQTSSSLIDDFLGLSDEKNLELTKWAYRADFETGGDLMNTARIIKLMHWLYSDAQVAKWFSTVVDAHFKAEQVNLVNLEEGKELFRKTLERFLSENKNTPAKKYFKRWTERLEKATEDKMNIVSVTTVNLMVLGPEKTTDWLMMAIKGVEEDQRLYWQAKEDFDKAEKVTIGNRVVVFGESSNPKFGHFCRSNAAKSLMPESMRQKGTPIAVQFQGKNRGFQIYTNRRNYNVSDVVAGLRVEILTVRNQRIPKNWRILKSEGTLPGTDPLYYHKASYEIVMWGSLTRPSVRQMDINQDTVKRVVITALDPDYFPLECQRSPKCLGSDCPLYAWLLARCAYKQRNENS